MTFDEHDPHASPRLYVADFPPRYAGVCAPHDQPGPWGPKTYFTEPIPYDRLHGEALQIIADAMEAENPFNLEEHVDQVLMQPTETVQSWDTFMRGEIALEALTSLHDNGDAARYEIVIYVGHADPWRLLVAKRFQSYVSKQIGDTVAFETNDVEDVRFFLAGHAWILGAIMFLTVVRRTSETTAVVFCGWDSERFYFLDSGNVLEGQIEASALIRGLSVFRDAGGSGIESGATEYFSWLKEWLARGAPGLPLGQGSID